MYELTEEISLDKNKKHNIEVVVDRLVVKEGIEKRLVDSIENVLELADGLDDGGCHWRGTDTVSQSFPVRTAVSALMRLSQEAFRLIILLVPARSVSALVTKWNLMRI
mgnify:CR=1 FL=1